MSAVPKTELKNPNNMQGQWVKVGSDVNLGTILDRQIDNKLKREWYGPVAGRRTFGIPSLE